MSWNEGVDIDGIAMTCPGCKETIYFGEFISSKNKCVFCVDKKEDPSLPLIELVERTIRTDKCGDA
tara:strand:- start:39761 stop:39958 length:198 start_codon:yes stop_codon:yes gene_type:complete